MDRKNHIPDKDMVLFYFFHIWRYNHDDSELNKL